MRAIIYCRKSTDRDDKQALSLPAQLDVCRRIAEERGLEVIEVIEESMSAKAPGRPEFARMMGIFYGGGADVLVCYHLNRLARNPIDGGTIQYATQKAVIKAIYTSEWSFTPDDNELVMSMYFGMSSQYIKELRTSVIRGMRKKVEQGGIVNVTPYGYTHEKGKVVVDESAVPVVREIMNLRSEGVAYREIASTLNKKGLKTKNSALWSVASVERIVKNKFYIGIAQWMGSQYAHSAPLFIDSTVFQRAQTRRRGVEVFKRQLYPLKGMVFSWDWKDVATKKPLRATLTKGKYTYYRTAPEIKKALYVSQSYICECFGEYLERVQLSKEALGELRNHLRAYHSDEVTAKTQQRGLIRREIDALSAKRSRLTDLRIAGDLDESEYREKKNDLLVKENTLKKEISRIETQCLDFEEKMNALVRTLENLSSTYKTLDERLRWVLIKAIAVELFFDPQKRLCVVENELFSALAKLSCLEWWTTRQIQPTLLARLYRGICQIDMRPLESILAETLR